MLASLYFWIYTLLKLLHIWLGELQTPALFRFALLFMKRYNTATEGGPDEVSFYMQNTAIELSAILKYWNGAIQKQCNTEMVQYRSGAMLKWCNTGPGEVSECNEMIQCWNIAILKRCTTEMVQTETVQYLKGGILHWNDVLLWWSELQAEAGAGCNSTKCQAQKLEPTSSKSEMWGGVLGRTM